jgi:hypothetical protein
MPDGRQGSERPASDVARSVLGLRMLLALVAWCSAPTCRHVPQPYALYIAGCYYSGTLRRMLQPPPASIGGSFEYAHVLSHMGEMGGAGISAFSLLYCTTTCCWLQRCALGGAFNHAFLLVARRQLCHIPQQRTCSSRSSYEEMSSVVSQRSTAASSLRAPSPTNSTAAPAQRQPAAQRGAH